jgi:hypothetical protein
MALHTRYRRKTPSSPEVQGLFFDKAQDNPAFFNPSKQTGDRGNSSTVVQRQEATPAAKEEEKPVQKQTKEEDKPVKKKDKEPVRVKGTAHPPSGISEAQQEQVTGLSDTLKARIEKLSGIPMDDVKVHYNSPKPIQIGALAYTQGTNIYIAPGQEQHLPHEVWHVVQQKQGRVMPTVQAQRVGVNDDAGLEHEATVMGQKASKQPSIA